ncbi:MAG: KH domain-containing protein [Deltaproteobacteria bacterium]|nr:KH domain-containing protein [Deltaproteobacteria bacterium]
MIALIEYLARSLGDHPESVAVTQEGEEYVLFVHPEDLSAIIGKHGRTIRAARALLAVASSKSGKRVSLRVDSLAAPPA